MSTKIVKALGAEERIAAKYKLHLGRALSWGIKRKSLNKATFGEWFQVRNAGRDGILHQNIPLFTCQGLTEVFALAQLSRDYHRRELLEHGSCDLAR